MNNTPTNFSSLLVLSWNCNGITHKIHELRSFVISNPHFDIILLQEVRLSKHIYNIPGFTLHYTPRPNAGPVGGTAIYIKSHIPHFPLQNTQLNGMDHTGIMLSFQHRKILIVSTYIRHVRPYPINDILDIFNLNTHAFLAGDFNAKNRRWNCHGTSSGGTSLHNLVVAHNFNLHAPATPTHPGNSRCRPSIIDFAISKNFPFPVTTNTLNIFNSDHYPVSFKIDIINPISPPPSVAINWKTFYDKLNNNNFTLHDINDTNDLERATAELEESIIDAQSEATAPSFKNNKPNYLILPNHINILIRQRNRTRRDFQRTRDPLLRPILNNLGHRIKTEIKRFKNKQWGDFLDSLSPQDNSLWRIKKKLNKDSNPIPPITVNNITAYTDLEKANFFANAYEVQFSPNPFDFNNPPLPLIFRTSTILLPTS